MPISCSNFATQIPIPRAFLRATAKIDYTNPHDFGFSPSILHKNSRPAVDNHPSSRCDCSQAIFSAPAQDYSDKSEFDRSMDLGNYSEELEIAVKAVHMASLLCQRVQESLLAKSNGHVQSKDDDSPVTVADWSVQATVSWVLSEAFGSQNVSILAEEDVLELSKTKSVNLLNAVTNTVNACLAESPSFGLKIPSTPLTTSDVLEAIGRCNSTGGPTGRFWVLDPVDGTLGFVRGDQYAIALSLIEDGEPVLGVLGCPNYPMKKEWLSYPNGYRRIISRLTSQVGPKSESWDKGCVIYARRGSDGAWMQPLLGEGKKFVWPNSARQIKVSTIDDPGLATFSIARGDAEIFMKFARAGYKEKIWDHAAGVVIIQEAGGVVTDAGGHPLCFSKGMYLEDLDRGIIACSGARLHEKIICAVDASWNSSSL
ncbi:pap-specific phosphatase hal2-like [Phtheirospermum japonicum]|uniref:Pap-specific phosphatase hal2-like n=1 Tax=Phtheirospermum japonicum TaxID=374723 RepID=A0A830CPT4_9LAMI|nr:pap-specific phosphatase hal2-like [Phtheirospermum japonicum]